MIKFLNKSFCLLLAILMLVSTTGFAVQKHICLMTGKEIKSSCCSSNSSHCEKEQTNTISKRSCCVDVTNYYHLNTTFSLKSLKAEIADAAVPVSQLFPFNKIIPSQILSHPQKTNVTDKALRLSMQLNV